MENNLGEQIVFTDQEKTKIVRYGAILLGVHSRLVMEGYFLDDGKTWNIFKVGTVLCTVDWEDDF